MPHICPRACSRLTGAAVFISVGVVQFIVGIILLRSKYLFLLAGPDFWTSGCNIAVGFLLGLSASVWKQSKKRQSKKQLIRRNLLLALLFSDLVINATTLGILLLGQGNTLLSIRLETDGKYSETTFATEVLAYAYVSSVCCPVVCIVVSIVSMSGSCFSSSARKHTMEMKHPMNSLQKNRSRSLQWVYTPEFLDLSNNKTRELVLTTSSESSSSDESEDIPIQQKHSNSMEELQCVLNRMAQGTRDNILKDSTIMLRQLDLRRKNKYNSLNEGASHMGTDVSRIKKSYLSERRAKDFPTRYDDSCYSKTENSRKHSVFESARLPQEDTTLKRISRSRNKLPDIVYRNPYTEELFKEYRNASSQVAAKDFSSQYRNFKEKLQTGSEVDGTMLGCSSDVTDYGNKSVAVHKKSKKMSEIETKSKALSTDHIHLKRSSTHNDQVIRRNERNPCYDADKNKEIVSPILNDCFSPDGSEFGADSTFELSRNNSWAGDIVPINVNYSSVARLSHKLIPVPSPVVPGIQQMHDLPKVFDDSGISTTESNSFHSEPTNQNEFKERKTNLSSFREDSKIRSKGNTEEYPKVGSQSTKKYDLNRMATMASISEEPNLELNQSETRAHCSSVCETDSTLSNWYFRKQSLPSASSESRKENHEENSEKDITPRRKRSISTKALKKMWSMAIDNQTDFLDQVVDDDSLIGLSEEELIARQLRNRSIRKAVQQRIKEEVVV